MKHEARGCPVCREQRRAVVDVSLLLSLGCLIALVVAAWWLPPVR